MIICGECGERHHEVATVRLCHAGLIHPCGWLVERTHYDQDGARATLIEECGAAAWELQGDGFRCEAGHEHVGLQERLAQGWDYADEQEAAGRAGYGLESRLMDGHVYMGP